VNHIDFSLIKQAYLTTTMHQTNFEVFSSLDVFDAWIDMDGADLVFEIEDESHAVDPSRG
jgi:hypothetical protein